MVQDYKLFIPEFLVLNGIQELPPLQVCVSHGTFSSFLHKPIKPP